MASPSKEENVLTLILENSPLKEWHFEEIKREAKVTKSVANKWLKKYVKEGLIKKNKDPGKFPHFSVGRENPAYYALKKVYALEQLNNNGVIAKLLSLKNAKTIILFGSIIKGDWYKNSDIDIFVYGNADEFNKNYYEIKLGRRIELQVFESEKDIREVRTGLIKNIINGYVVKGQIQDFAKVT